MNIKLLLALLIFIAIKPVMAIVYRDLDRDRAIITYQDNNGGLKLYTCEPFTLVLAERAYSAGASHSYLRGCRELTTKHLPVIKEDIKLALSSPLRRPIHWHLKSSDEIWEELNRHSSMFFKGSEFQLLFELINQSLDRRKTIAKTKVMPLRLRVQDDPEYSFEFTRNRKYTTCTASMIKLDGKCHIFTNEHCISHRQNIMILDAPELTAQNWRVYEKLVAPEWDLLTLEIPDSLNSRFCPMLEDHGRLAEIAPYILKPAFYSFGYSGRSGDEKIDIFSSRVDEVLFNAGDTISGSIPRRVPLEFPGGSAILYNYLPTYRGMSGGVITSETGTPLCLIHRTIPFQDTPQCIGLYYLKKLVDGELQRADRDNPNIDRRLFLRTYEKKQPNNTLFFPLQNLDSPYIDVGNTAIPPGRDFNYNDYLPLSFLPYLSEEYVREAYENANPLQQIPLFIEPNEGIFDHTDKDGRRLLAVRCNAFSPWLQIDGQEDYQHKLSYLCPEVLKLSDQNKIYHENEGFVEKKYRMLILDRLAGRYMTLVTKTSGRVLHFDNLPGDVSLLTPVKREAVYHQIDINANKQTIRIQLANEIGPSLDGLIFAKFVVEFLDEGREIKLTPILNFGKEEVAKHIGEMRCRNNNYQKLICLSKTSVLSFSLKNTDEMAIRLTVFDPVTRKMIHIFGDLYENL